jgi:hypothetical protein
MYYDEFKEESSTVWVRLPFSVVCPVVVNVPPTVVLPEVSTLNLVIPLTD